MLKIILDHHDALHLERFLIQRIGQLFRKLPSLLVRDPEMFFSSSFETAFPPDHASDKLPDLLCVLLQLGLELKDPLPDLVRFHLGLSLRLKPILGSNKEPRK